MKNFLSLALISAVVLALLGCPSPAVDEVKEQAKAPSIMYDGAILQAEDELDFSKGLSFSSETEGALISYKFSGQSSYSRLDNGVSKVNRIPDGSTSVTVKAVKNGLKDSTEVTIRFSQAKVTSPVIATDGHYNAATGDKAVTITSDEGAIIYYELNAYSNPSRDSTEYTGEFTVNVKSFSITVRAFAVKDGYKDSVISETRISSAGSVETPTINYDGSALQNNAKLDFSKGLTFESTTEEATISYKWDDGSFAEIAENTLTEAIPAGTTSVTIKASKEGYNDSTEVTRRFSQAQAEMPRFSDSGSSITEGSSISITAEPEAKIYYTTGTEAFVSETPTENGWLEYSNALTIQFAGKAAVTYRAIVVQDGLLHSEIATEKYIVDNLMTMVTVTGGTFTMGEGHIPSSPLDTLITRETSVKNFLLAEAEVTQEQWLAVMDTWPGDGYPDRSPTEEYGLGDTHPVYNISWYDAILFCNMLSRSEGLEPVYYLDKDGNGTYDTDVDWFSVDSLQHDGNIVADWDASGYRLPTEAEWEYAAGHGGGTGNTRHNYAGVTINVDTDRNGIDDTNPAADLHDYAIYNDLNLVTKATSSKAVKSKDANPLNLYDMSGNVFEWCWDTYEGYNAQDADNPKGPTIATANEDAIIRGGSWEDWATEYGGTGTGLLCVSSRDFTNRDFENTDSRTTVFIGFRVARNVGN